MIKIDAHQHFWQFDPVRDAWIDNTMKVIQRDFLPEDLQPVLAANKVDGCIAVQADQSETETEFLLQLAGENSFIKGVVGWVDLVAENVAQRLAHFSQNTIFKGIRHIAQAEAADYFLRKDVQKGIGQLHQFDLTFDILVFENQLPAAIELVRQFPDQKFVLDHIAKPKVSEGISEQWKADIKRLASCKNVSCKLSGMVTETAGFQWQKQEFTPFLDWVVSSFGVGRVLYGSDWPVCLVAAKYEEQLAIVEDYFAGFSAEERARIMGGNAIEFYNLSAE